MLKGGTTDNSGMQGRIMNEMGPEANNKKWRPLAPSCVEAPFLSYMLNFFLCFLGASF